MVKECVALINCNTTFDLIAFNMFASSVGLHVFWCAQCDTELRFCNQVSYPVILWLCCGTLLMIVLLLIHVHQIIIRLRFEIPESLNSFTYPQNTQSHNGTITPPVDQLWNQFDQINQSDSSMDVDLNDFLSLPGQQAVFLSTSRENAAPELLSDVTQG